jgi:hypothetical protein
MKEFLNRYMAGNRNFQRQSEDQLKNVFESTVSLIRGGVGVSAFRPKHTVNAAVVDSLMFGVASRIAAGPVTSESDLRAAYDILLNNAQYQHATTRATADEESVKTRLQLAKAAFANVP